MIYFTSDFHFAHDRDFIYAARGFKNIEEMNKEIVERMNFFIKPEDDLYILGDIMLKDNERGMELLDQINGWFHIIRGNHDTDTRMQLYENHPRVVEVCDAKYLRWESYHFFLSHYPCLTGNLQKEMLKQMTLNLHGHTHDTDPFFNDLFYCYNVGVDAHNCYPVLINQIIIDMKEKMRE